MCEELSTELVEKCHKLCSEYVWLNVRPNEVIYKRITGGFTNQMICCQLNKQMDSSEDIPKDIAIKLYRMSERPLDATDSPFNDLIIGLIISELRLGPKIYGISSDAILMEYYEVWRHI